MRELYLKLISYTNRMGPSSTKFVWLHTGVASVYCSVLMVIGGVSMYVACRVADPTYWTATVGMWTATLGFAGSVKKNQDKQGSDDDNKNSNVS